MDFHINTFHFVDKYVYFQLQNYFILKLKVTLHETRFIRGECKAIQI